MNIRRILSRSILTTVFSKSQAEAGTIRQMVARAPFTITACCLLLLVCLLALSVDSQARPELEGSDATIDLDSSAFVGFVDVHTTDTRVLAIGPITVSVEATGLGAHNAASLRIYTQNDPETVRSGMVGQSVPSETVPVKVWTPNFGDGYDSDLDGIPDIQDDRNWKGPTEAVWVFVFDTEQAVAEILPPWDHPLFDYTDLFKWSNAHPNPNYHLPPSGVLSLEQPIYLALVLHGKARPQVYSTTVYVEFALSDDYGETYTAHTASRPLTVTLNDAEPIVSLEVDSSEFGGFSGLGPWPQRVMASGPLTLPLSAYGLYPYDAATLRVYTRNDPDDPVQLHMGMVGHLNRDKTVPIKVWTPNFGQGIDQDGDGIPDPDNNTNWRDNEKAVWVFAFDWNQPITETWWNALPPEHEYYDPNCAWCTPLFNYTDLYKWSDYHDRLDDYGDYVYHLPQYLELIDRRPQMGQDDRVPLYIAADLVDALPQTYSTTLYIEFALSSDKGETVSRNVLEALPISATVPGDGSPINWLLNRVRMRPDLDGPEGSVKKLADSHQEPWDWSDGGWTYDQALAIMALTAAGHAEEARQLLNGLDYLQNNDGSWFFSYMTSATDELIHAWATTDEATLYDGTDCLTLTEAIPNGYPDELEKRVCWDETHDLPVDQIGPWILENYTSTVSPQTGTYLPNKIKYRTYDFRKYLGTNAWVVMAANFYELYTGDDSYRQMAEEALAWITSYQELDSGSPAYGGVAMGRVWRRDLVTDTLETTYGFLDWDIYVAEHNFDAYSALRGMGLLTGDKSYSEKAEWIRSFLLRELWAPHVNTGLHSEVDPAAIDNYFFPGINMTEPLTPQGVLDTSCVYLDGLTWSNLALGPRTKVLGKDGEPSTLVQALDYADATMLVTDATIFTGTGYMVTGIDGYKESTCSPDLVWSEGSEGMVAARYLAGGAENEAKAGTYHAETASYRMPNGGVPYSNKPPNPSDPFWNWTDANSIAGTAWFLFNEQGLRVNPFQPWTTRHVDCISGQDSGDCAASPCQTIGYALNQANNGDTVQVAACTYTESLTLDRPVNLMGHNAQDTIVHALDGQRVMTITGETITNSTVISGLMFTGGNPVTGAVGGGILVSASSPTLHSNHVISNTSGAEGGGLYIVDSPGIVLTRTMISNNRAADGKAGGGLYISDSPSTILVSNIISGNTGHRGGGLWIDHSSGTMLTTNTIVGNKAQTGWGEKFGGGVYALSSDDLTFVGNTVKGNTASNLGGGLYIQACDNLDLSRNWISQNGGGNCEGLYCQTCEDANLTNNFVGESQITDRNTICLSFSSARLLHTTIVGNQASDGSGVHITGAASAVALTNTIVAGHSVGISVTAGSTAIVDGVLWWDNDENTRGDGQITVTHAYTGNPRFVDPDAGNYHIGPGSAAIDRGVLSDVDTDIDGHSRLGFSGLPDLGADEFRCFLYLPLVAKNMPHR